jgi:hypothetical protein
MMVSSIPSQRDGRPFGASVDTERRRVDRGAFEAPVIAATPVIGLDL